MRKLFLPALLILVSGICCVKYWNSYILSPGKCSGELPQFLPQLVSLARQNGIPGFQLSILYPDGQRIHCAAGQKTPIAKFKPMREDYNIRYASLSKMFTSLVTLQIIDEGRLHLSTKLTTFFPAWLSLNDEQINNITIGQLLDHTAGFDRGISGDPMLQPEPWCPSKLEAITTIKLDYEPGTRYSYSNLGYCLLGAVLEKIEQKPIKDIFLERLFNPAGAKNINLAQHGTYLPNESLYYFQPPEQEHQLIDLPYDSLHAVGAWTGNATDLLSVLSRSVNQTNPNTFFEYASPNNKYRCDESKWRICYHLGFYTYKSSVIAPRFYWRDGSLPGVSAFAGFSENGGAVVFLANSRPLAWMQFNDRIGLLLANSLQ